MRLLLLVLVISFQSVKAQTYTIIHVIGKIYDTSASAYLKPGYKLAETAELKFESPNAKAAVLSSARGRYVIQKQSAQSQTGDLAYTLSAVLSPARGKMSTRAGGINNAMDFTKKFEEGPVAVVNGAYEVAVSPNSYPTNDIRFFYASYVFNKDGINKKLEVIDGKLIFDMKSFYAVDGIPIDPSQTSETQLFYYDSDQQESTPIAFLNFAIVSDDVFRTIQSSLDHLSGDEKVTAIQEVVGSLYGKCSEDQIRSAIQKMN